MNLIKFKIVQVFPNGSCFFITKAITLNFCKFISLYKKILSITYKNKQQKAQNFSVLKTKIFYSKNDR